MTARDPQWALRPGPCSSGSTMARSDGDGPDWSTSSLRNMITRATQTPEG